MPMPKKPKLPFNEMQKRLRTEIAKSAEKNIHESSHWHSKEFNGHYVHFTKTHKKIFEKRIITRALGLTPEKAKEFWKVLRTRDWVLNYAGNKKYKSETQIQSGLQHIELLLKMHRKTSRGGQKANQVTLALKKMNQELSRKGKITEPDGFIAMEYVLEKYFKKNSDKINAYNTLKKQLDKIIEEEKETAAKKANKKLRKK